MIASWHQIIQIGVCKNAINISINTLEGLKWGLVPSWAKDKDFKALINARLETIDEKVSFKKLIKNNRCVAVADGFYEWKREEKEKTPHYFTREDTNTIYFAGIFLLCMLF